MTRARGMVGPGVAGLFMLGVLGLGAPAAWAVGGECVPKCSGGPQPTCATQTVVWGGDCGPTSCSRSLQWNACNAPEPTQCGQTESGTQTSTTGGCKRTCSKTKTCDKAASYVPYGYAVPGDSSVYGFSHVPAFNKAYTTSDNSDMLGLSAKGNIVVGDYTSPAFQKYVTPKLTYNGTESLVQPYVVSATDAPLGYDNATPGVCGGRSPCFNGHYTDPDNGTYYNEDKEKKDKEKTRKFYESSLPPEQFQALIDPEDPLYARDQPARLDAVLYTNHAIAGYVPHKDPGRVLSLNGTVVGRDDALVIESDFTINHDMRLNLRDAPSPYLPVGVIRSTLSHWQECPPAGCP